MLEKIDLSKRVAKDTYKKGMEMCIRDRVNVDAEGADYLAV